MIKSLSASSITTYEMCPKMFKFEYIERMLPLPSDALLIGEMVHLALKYFHQNKDPYQEIKNKLLKPVTKEGIDKFGQIRKLVDAYIQNPIKDETVEFEKRFRIPLEKLEIPLTGIIDRQTQDGIIEYKTSNQDYTQEQIDKHIQGTIYAYAYEYLMKKEGKITFCILNKKEYKVQILTTRRTKKDFEELFKRTKTTYNCIKEENFEPTPGNQCYWCGFRLECPNKFKK